MVSLKGFFTLGLAEKKKAQLLWAVARKRVATTDLSEQDITIERKATEAGTGLIQKIGSVIIIQDGIWSKDISQVHARLTWNKADKRYEVQDLASARGTLKNAERLIPGKKYVLKNHDTVTMGRNTTFQIFY